MYFVHLPCNDLSDFKTAVLRSQDHRGQLMELMHRSQRNDPQNLQESRQRIWMDNQRKDWPENQEPRVVVNSFDIALFFSILTQTLVFNTAHSGTNQQGREDARGTCMHDCIHTCTYPCMHVCMYARTYAYINVCIMHTYT